MTNLVVKCSPLSIRPSIGVSASMPHTVRDLLDGTALRDLIANAVDIGAYVPSALFIAHPHPFYLTTLTPTPESRTIKSKEANSPAK